MIKEKSEWELGADSTGRNIWLKVKGFTDSRFYHSFIPISDAEELANKILLVVEELKKRCEGKCCQCDDYITNGDKFYEIQPNKKVHKNCVGEYLEKNLIESKLIPKEASDFTTREITYNNFSTKKK